MTTVVLNVIQDHLNDVYKHYLWILSLSDPRTRGWTLVDSPISTLGHIILYLLIVWLGRKLMKNRDPFKLTWVVILYDFAMAALSLYISLKFFIASIRLKYNYTCQPYRLSYNSDELEIANAMWLFYISKLLQFCDTYFFILRKKSRQLTFLHIYHHASMFGIWWIGVKWIPSGSTFLPAMANAAMHVIVYSYYGISVLRPQYVWWKKYITLLQLAQFGCAIILVINGIRTGCEYPRWMLYGLIIYIISFMCLFGHFYIKTYTNMGLKSFYQIDMGCGQGILDNNDNDYKLSSKSTQHHRENKDDVQSDSNKKFD